MTQRAYKEEEGGFWEEQVGEDIIAYTLDDNRTICSVMSMLPGAIVKMVSMSPVYLNVLFCSRRVAEFVAWHMIEI